MRLATALHFLLLFSIASKVFGASSRPLKKRAITDGISSITDGVLSIQSPSQSSPQPVNVITTIANTFPDLGAEIKSLLREENVSSCKEFKDKMFNKPKEKSKGNYQPPPNDVTIPLTIRDEDETLDKFKSILYETMTTLRKDGLGPRDDNDKEEEIWDTLAVLGYLLVQKLHPLVDSKCVNGEFQCKTIDKFKVGDELRGVYRMFKGGIVKTGLSNEVEGGVIVRMYRQCLGLQLEDDIDIYDEEADDADKKRISVKDAKEYLESHHEEDVAVYFTVDEQIEMVQSDESIMDIVKAIGMIASPFAGWDESMLDKRNEEILNYGFEAVCASSFGGSKYHNVMEMFFCLGSASLRKLIEPPTLNKKAIEILNSYGLSKDEIKVVLTWQHATSALRTKREKLSNSTNASDNMLGGAIGDCIHGFRPGDYAGFLKKYELLKTFDTEAITCLDDYQSETYAKVVAVANELNNILASDNICDETKKSLLRDSIKTLNGLKRYDKPKDDGAYEKYANNVLKEAKEVVSNNGMIVLEKVLKEVATDFETIFPTHCIESIIKNADGTEAGTLYSTEDTSLAPVLVTPSWHVRRGVNNSDGDRAVVGRSQLTIMTLMNQLDNKIVSDDALAAQVKSLYTQLLWTEGIKGCTIGEAITDRKLKCGGSSHKGRIVTLPINTSRGDVVRSGVLFISKMMSGKSVFDSVSGLQNNVNSDVSIDNVVVACSIAELGLANFARMMDIGYGLNSQNTGIVDGDSFSEGWLDLEHRLKCEESRKNIQVRYGPRDDNEGQGSGDDDGEEIGDGGEVEDGDEGESSSDEEELPFAVFGAAPTRG